MTTLQEMHQRTTSIKEHDLMIRSITPFFDCFNISQFYYTRVYSSGKYTTLGTHIGLNEFLYDRLELLRSCPVLRNPEILQSGISFPRYTHDAVYSKYQNDVWNKFKLKFSVNLVRKTPFGAECFGFGVKHADPRIDQQLLNELPLVYKFIDFFRNENKKLLQISYENQVDIASLLGSCYNEEPITNQSNEKRNLLLKQLGLDAMLQLTQRESEIMKFLANGFPAHYIAKQLYLSSRTVENYIATIKMKFDCNSKVELIRKAQETIINNAL